MIDKSMPFEEWYPQTQAALSGRPDGAAIVTRMIEDPALWQPFLRYLQTGTADPATRGSFVTWPEGQDMPNPALGQLMDGGMDAMEAFLYLAGLAGEVNERISGLIGRYEAGEIGLEDL